MPEGSGLKEYGFILVHGLSVHSLSLLCLCPSGITAEVVGGGGECQRSIIPSVGIPIVSFSPRGPCPVSKLYNISH